MNFSSLIDKYLEGKLSGKELERFEQELTNNPAFAETVRKLKSLHNTISKYLPEMGLPDEKISEKDKGIENEVDLDIERYSSDRLEDSPQRIRDRQLIRKVFREHRPISKPKYCFINRCWIPVACVIAFLSLGAILFFCRVQFDPSRTFEKYYSLPSFDPRIRAPQPEQGFVTDPENASGQDLFYAARIHYTRGEYRKTIELLSWIPDTSQYEEQCHLIAGIAYMKLGKYNQAIIELREVDEEILLVDTAKWYLGMSYLKTGELEKALGEFDYLKSREHTFGHFSRKISRQLSRYLKNRPLPE